jgi:hypothetical protein
MEEVAVTVECIEARAYQYSQGINCLGSETRDVMRARSRTGAGAGELIEGSE